MSKHVKAKYRIVHQYAVESSKASTMYVVLLAFSWMWVSLCVCVRRSGYYPPVSLPTTVPGSLNNLGSTGARKSMYTGYTCASCHCCSLWYGKAQQGQLVLLLSFLPSFFPFVPDYFQARSLHLPTVQRTNSPYYLGMYLFSWLASHDPGRQPSRGKDCTCGPVRTWSREFYDRLQIPSHKDCTQ